MTATSARISATATSSTARRERVVVRAPREARIPISAQPARASGHHGGDRAPTEREIVPRKPICRRSAPRPRVGLPVSPTAPDGTSTGSRLQGKRAFVTGGARGIGRATVERFLAEGAQVASLDIDDETAEGALVLRGDVADEQAVERAFAEAGRAFGGLDAIVPNAATQLVGEDDRADRLDRAVWQRTLDVNLTGAFLAAKHGIRALLAGGGGALVFTASPAGVYGIAPGLDAYSASK